MSEMQDMIIEVAERMFKQHVTQALVDLLENNQWAESLWQLIEENGLPVVALDEVQGGAGGDLSDLLQLIRLTGKYAAPIPFIETTLANYFLQLARLAPVEETATYHLDATAFTLNGETLTGTASHIHWARHVRYFLTLAQAETNTYLVVIDLALSTRTAGQNLASEPRDAVHFEQAPILQCSGPLTETELNRLHTIDTTGQLALMTGAIERINDLTIRYTKERQQFGRPIHRFQLVQQHLVHLVAETTIAVANFENVVVNLQQQEVAYARLRMEDAIQTVTTIAHQVHAAIGTTQEYPLQLYTRRLWAWREEGLPHQDWANIIAEKLASSEDLWAFLTEINTKGDMK